MGPRDRYANQSYSFSLGKFGSAWFRSFTTNRIEIDVEIVAFFFSPFFFFQQNLTKISFSTYHWRFY